MLDIFVVLIAIVVGVFSVFLSMGLIFGITMPFVGTLIRYRANYTPKAGAVRLDGEDGLGGTPSSEKAPSYFGMMKRVYRIEGWAGLYKGLMPSIITTLILTVALVPFSVLLSAGYKVHPHGRVSLPAQSGVVMWLLSFALSTIPVLILVPMLIIINRAITTPHKLAAFDARAALRVLLSPAERAQPLRLYLAPGVALAFVLEALVGPTVSLLRYLAAPRLPLGAALGAAVPVLLLTTALVTPLQVMQARLTLQRRGPEAPDADIPLASGEAVMDFRTQEEPYTGLIDCARKMVHEEGWGVLTRAWWLTALSMLLPLLTPAMVPQTVPGDL
ncbi:hypothetical protein FB451DRAFT_719078 [Mycena latifolia]|nr:hypothetical protein FB451DRAFT_719078 [Mycena latifolia]